MKKEIKPSCGLEKLMKNTYYINSIKIYHKIYTLNVVKAIKLHELLNIRTRVLNHKQITL